MGNCSELLSEEEQNRIMSKACVRQFGLSVKKGCHTHFFKCSRLDLTSVKIHVYKDATKNRISQDEDAVTNIIMVIEERMTNPFRVSPDWIADEPQPLRSISTGMVETDEVSSWIKQIYVDGTKQLTEFV